MGGGGGGGGGGVFAGHYGIIHDTHVVYNLSYAPRQSYMVYVSATAPFVVKKFRQFQFTSHLYKVHLCQKFNRRKFITCVA